MAEITRLSVGKALDKLRDTDAPASKMARLDEKIVALDQETQRLRATRLLIERSQSTSSTGRAAKEATPAGPSKLKLSAIILGVAVVPAAVLWMCWSLWR